MKRILKLLIFGIVLMVTLTGCVRMDVQFNRDGSGEMTLSMSKTALIDGAPATKESFKAIISKKINEINIHSADEFRVSLKSVTENEQGFIAAIKFRKIWKTTGAGIYKFSSVAEFRGQLNNRDMINRMADGDFGTLSNANYTVVKVDKDASLGINAKEVGTGAAYSPRELMALDELASDENNQIFLFIAFDVGDIESISVKLPGKIKYVSDKNVTVKDDNTLVITPFSAEAKITSLEEGGAVITPMTVQGIAGYVIFEMPPRYGWVAVCAFLAAGLGLLIWLGVKRGWWKRAYDSPAAVYVRKNADLYLFMLPGILLLFVFSYVPKAGLIVAFKNYTTEEGIFGSEWVGLKHFVTLFTAEGVNFDLIFRNTVVIAFLRLVTSFPSAIILALLFNELRNGLFKKSVQTISYLPYFISWIIVSGMAYNFLAADNGILNNLLEKLGREPVVWYSNPRPWWGILTITSLWKSIGWGTITYLAAISAINPELYEASAIDGAGKLRQTFTVTLPGMMPIIGITLILSMGSLIRDDFEQIYAMVGSENYLLNETTNVFSTVVFKALRGGPKGFSSATALGLFQSIIALILVLTSNWIVRKTDNPGLW